MTNPWLDHVKKTKAENPNLSLKEVMLKAKETYKKTPQNIDSQKQSQQEASDGKSNTTFSSPVDSVQENSREVTLHPDLELNPGQIEAKQSLYLQQERIDGNLRQDEAPVHHQDKILMLHDKVLENEQIENLRFYRKLGIISVAITIIALIVFAGLTYSGKLMGDTSVSVNPNISVENEYSNTIQNNNSFTIQNSPMSYNNFTIHIENKIYVNSSS